MTKFQILCSAIGFGFLATAALFVLALTGLWVAITVKGVIRKRHIRKHVSKGNRLS
jgi:hypothetical protein